MKTVIQQIREAAEDQLREEGKLPAAPQVREIAIYNESLSLIIGYELQKFEQDTDGIFKITGRKRIYFDQD